MSECATAFESSAAREVAIKILEIKQSAASAAVMPSGAHVGDGSYTLRRPYFLYFDSKASPAVRSTLFLSSKKVGPTGPIIGESKEPSERDAV